MMELNGMLLSVQVATFLAAMVIIWKLFWGPLTRFMKERSSQIAGDLERAERGKRDIEVLEAEYSTRLSDLEARAQQEIKDALAQGTKLKEQILTEARQEAKRILDKAQGDLSQERERVVRELRTHITELSLQAVERLLGQGLDAQAQKHLLNQFVSDLEPAGKR
ncbi:MAG: F0F1 ATP synthase subunit B [Candidatus Firestonebacteria bacterium]|nr:F0F1 ATP synthase subunit B [Candidatus Firestonebacteria bacterium]